MSGCGSLLRILFALILVAVSAYGSYALYKHSDFITSEHCHRFSASIVAVVIASGLLGLNILGSTFCLGTCCSFIMGALLLICYLVADTYFVVTFIRMDDCCRDLFKKKMTEFYNFTVVNFIVSAVFLVTLIVVMVYKSCQRRKVGAYGTSDSDSGVRLV
jgi:hypothetical protein